MIKYTLETTDQDGNVTLNSPGGEWHGGRESFMEAVWSWARGRTEVNNIAYLYVISWGDGHES